MPKVSRRVIWSGFNSRRWRTHAVEGKVSNQRLNRIPSDCAQYYLVFLSSQSVALSLNCDLQATVQLVYTLQQIEES